MSVITNAIAAIKRYAKGASAAVGAIILILNTVLPVLTGDDKKIVTSVLSALTVLAVVLVPNKPATQTVTAPVVGPGLDTPSV